MKVVVQPTRLMVASRVLSDLAYVGLCLAAVMVFFPDFRIWLQGRAMQAAVRIQVAIQRTRAPAWTHSLSREDLPAEDLPKPAEE